MSIPVAYRIAEDGRVVISKDAKFPTLRGPDKSALKPDLHIKIDQRVWGVNSCVLRACSKMIDDMLDSIVLESRSSEIPVDSSCVQPNVFEQILDLIYDGEVEVQAGDIFALHSASDFLEYTELAEACIAFLQEHLDVNLLAKAWKYANSHSQGASVVQICQQKIPDVFEEWSKIEDFRLLTFEELSSVMEIAKLRIKNPNENIIFEAIVRWLYSDWSGRCRYINAMLAKVYWKRLDTGKAINCDTVRAICQADVRSLEEREAMIMLLRAIGLGPDGDFQMLFGVKVSEPPDHVVAGISKYSPCEIVLSTLDNNTHSEVKKETLAIPPEMRVEGMHSCDMCSFDSRLYMLAEVLSASVYVLYEYDRESGVFQYVVLRPPPGRGTFDSPQCTRVFLDGARVFIANENIEWNGIAVYYMARDELVFSQNPLVDVDGVASCQLLAVDTPRPDYARELLNSTLAFDDVAGRMYYCCGWIDGDFKGSNLVFYLDLQSKAFVRCPDYPLELGYAAATVHEGSLLVAGGRVENDESTPMVWRLDKDGTDWVELPSLNMGHCYGDLLVKDGLLYHFDTDDEQVVLETLDLMNPQDGWKMNNNSEGMFKSMKRVCAFLS